MSRNGGRARISLFHMSHIKHGKKRSCSSSSAWVHGGYNEIQNPPRRYTLIDREQLIACCGVGLDEQFWKEHRNWVEGAVSNSNGNAREPR
jgi:hypothetical protein